MTSRWPTGRCVAARGRPPQRCIAVETNGLLVRAVVLSAKVQDWDGLQDLCGLLLPVSPRLHAGWVDGGFAASVATVEDQFGWHVAVVTKLAGPRGCVVQPRRWAVKRTCASLTTCRRPATDYEVYTETSTAFIYLAMIHLMLRRLVPDPTNRRRKSSIAA
jgi:putative transposase